MPRKPVIQDRRAHIITSAEKLFGRVGYIKTTMQEISREAHIPRATIYLDFPGGKEDILMASAERYLNHLLAEMKRIARQSRKGRLETLRQVVLYYILTTYDSATRHPFDAQTLERHTRRIKDEMGAFFEARLQLFTDLIRQAAMTGEIAPNHDAARLAELVGHGMQCYLPPTGYRFTREELSRNASAFFSLLLSGMARTSQRTPVL